MEQNTGEGGSPDLYSKVIQNPEEHLGEVFPRDLPLLGYRRLCKGSQELNLH